MPLPIPEAVLEFTSAHVASVEELEVLVALVESGDRWWDPGMVSREIGISLRSARTILYRLAASNLLDIKVTGDVRYQFGPSDPEVTQQARAFVSVYRRQPAALLHLVAQSGGRSVRDFADAFRIRRHDPR